MKEILTLVQLQQEGEIVIASIGGFDIEYSGERIGRDGYRYTTMLLRTGAEYEIELPVTVTPLGAVARLEHAVDDFEGERERYRQRLADARRRLASYESRDGGDIRLRRGARRKAPATRRGRRRTCRRRAKARARWLWHA